MDELESLKTNFVVDEFGRVIINDFELMKQINGAGNPALNILSNTACGSNGACANAACK